jgi:hypothetical protein
MGYIHQVMDNEHQRLKALSQKYRDKIESFPKETVSVKKRKNREYLYLARRKDGKVKFDYIGPVASGMAQKVLALISEKKHYAALGDFRKRIPQTPGTSLEFRL